MERPRLVARGVPARARWPLPERLHATVV